MTLSDILHPVSVADFLSLYFNAAPLHVPGPAARFASLSAPAVASLLHDVELHLEAPVRIVPRAQWEGLPVHRCERDLMVFHTAGRDLWRVYGRGPEAATEAAWQCEMNEGDMLYIPLGVWCSAEPQGPPSLNLTLHIENPTGAGLLVWLSEKLQRLDAFAADIPRFAGPAVKSEYLAAMRHAVVQAFRRPDLLERFHRHLNNYAPLPPAPETPWSEGGSAGRWIQLISPRRPAVRRRDHETIHIRAGGRDFPFPLDAAPLLRFLFDQAPVATAEFYAEFEGEFDRDEITEFLQVLHQAGIIGLADAEFAA